MPDNRDAFKFEAAGALTVGANKDRWVAPFNGEVIGAVATVGVQPTGATLIFDVLKNGVSIYTVNTKPTVAVSTSTSPFAPSDAAVPPAAAAGRFVTGDVFSLSVTQVGSTVAGSDADVTVEYVA
jgi:hypothetical protein